VYAHASRICSSREGGGTKNPLDSEMKRQGLPRSVSYGKKYSKKRTGEKGKKEKEEKKRRRKQHPFDKRWRFRTRAAEVAKRTLLTGRMCSQKQSNDGNALHGPGGRKKIAQKTIDQVTERRHSRCASHKSATGNRGSSQREEIRCSAQKKNRNAEGRTSGKRE